MHVYFTVNQRFQLRCHQLGRQWNASVLGHEQRLRVRIPEPLPGRVQLAQRVVYVARSPVLGTAGLLVAPGCEVELTVGRADNVQEPPPARVNWSVLAYFKKGEMRSSLHSNIKEKSGLVNRHQVSCT